MVDFWQTYIVSNSFLYPSIDKQPHAVLTYEVTIRYVRLY